MYGHYTINRDVFALAVNENRKFSNSMQLLIIFVCVLLIKVI